MRASTAVSLEVLVFQIKSSIMECYDQLEFNLFHFSQRVYFFSYTGSIIYVV